MAMNLTQPNYPIPPPPPPPTETPARAKSTFHGPGTHFFPSIRMNLTTLEYGLQGIFKAILKKGVIIALILGATLSFALSFVVQLATGLSSTSWALFAVVAPVTEDSKV